MNKRIGDGVANGRAEVQSLRANSWPQGKPQLLRSLILQTFFLVVARPAFATSEDPAQMPNMFKPQATPAHDTFHLSLLVLAISAVIFIIVFSLLTYSVIKFRRRADDDGREPAPVYGSNQIELAWTVIPVLIVLVLFLATARVIHAIQQASKPAGAIEVIAIGHQFWWEFRYPALGVVTANELHVPTSDSKHPMPTFITLLSADTDHSFWVPRLAGKTDLIPNRDNHTWIDPSEAGVYVGQCAQYCGTQHAKMLLRVYAESPEQFQQWAQKQAKPAQVSEDVKEGRRVFETTACINCHAISGTVADGRYGPDLTHLMSRETIASGAAPNTHENLQLWIENPNAIKPGALMPAMKLNERDLAAVTSYLETLR
jgi:cytochrome c oxidase subunit II